MSSTLFAFLGRPGPHFSRRISQHAGMRLNEISSRHFVAPMPRRRFCVVPTAAGLVLESDLRYGVITSKSRPTTTGPLYCCLIARTMSSGLVSASRVQWVRTSIFALARAAISPSSAALVWASLSYFIHCSTDKEGFPGLGPLPAYTSWTSASHPLQAATTELAGDVSPEMTMDLPPAS